MRLEIIRKNYKISKFTEKFLEILGIEAKQYMNVYDIVEKLNGRIYTKACSIKNYYEIYKTEKETHSFEIVIDERYTSVKRREWIAFAISELILSHGYFVDIEKWNKKECNKDLVNYWMDDREMSDKIFLMAHALLLDWTLFKRALKDSYRGDGYYDVGEVAMKFEVSEKMVINRGRLIQMLAW